jgi:dihydroorotate dehydrogenase
VQVYSGLIFRGPELAREIAEGLAWRQRPWI